MSCRAAAERFGVAAASAVRWFRAWQTDGRVVAKPKGGDTRSQRIEAYRAVILAAVEAKVDISLVELAEMLAREHGVRVAPSTIWRFLDRHDMTVKKNSARQRANQTRRRQAACGLVRVAA
jgi:transposase